MNARLLTTIILFILISSAVHAQLHEMPVVDSVSILPNEDIIIGWEAYSADHLAGYVIYQKIQTSTGPKNDSIDFVPVADGEFYILPGKYPCDSIYAFGISAIDSLGNESPGSYDTPHRTLLIEAIQYDPCDKDDLISWHPYINFDPPLGGYRLYVSENGGPFQLLISLTASDTSFVHENLASTTRYEYFVRAFAEGNTKTSTSCRKSITTYESPEPQFMYQRYGTVPDDEQVVFKFFTDTSAYVQYYRVFRSENRNGPYDEIGTVAPTNAPTLTYFDQTAMVDQTSYFYKVTVIDSCDKELPASNISRTILLRATARHDRTNLLEWNEYEEWEGSVAHYDIYRLVDGQSNMTPIGQVSSGNILYIDDVSAFSSDNNYISYFVEAIEGAGIFYDFQDTSRSNIAEAVQESSVYMPNGFIPNGVSGDLKPVLSYVGESGYLYIIYNRWGQMIFQTNQRDQGWDGTYQGQFVESGVYVYLIRYSNALNERVEIAGNVAVVF